MRCSCRVCGEYMVQAERGIFCECVCPVCANTCKDCMGVTTQPLKKEELIKVYQERIALENKNNIDE